MSLLIYADRVEHPIVFVVRVLICSERASKVLQASSLNIAETAPSANARQKENERTINKMYLICNKQSVDKQGTHLHPVSGRCHSLNPFRSSFPFSWSTRLSPYLFKVHELP